MPYITSVERLGIEKGIEKGRAESRRALFEVLEARFGALDPDLTERIHAVKDGPTIERARKFSRRA
jgi:hypothetical protein